MSLTRPKISERTFIDTSQIFPNALQLFSDVFRGNNLATNRSRFRFTGCQVPGALGAYLMEKWKPPPSEAHHTTELGELRCQVLCTMIPWIRNGA